MQAGNEIATAYLPLVRGIVTRILGSHRRMEVEDATQAAFLHVFSAIPRWRENCPFCCFLATVAARRCVDFVRHMDSDRHVMLPSIELAAQQIPTTDEETISRLEKAVSEYPVDFQIAWKMRMSNCPVSEICQHLKLGERAVYYRIAAIRARLADVIVE